MKNILIIFTAAALTFITGCSGPGKTDSAKTLLSVDFQKGQTIRYKFTSKREIELDWGKLKKSSKTGQSKVDKTSESMELIVAYTPIEIDPYGMTKISATCQSITTNRVSRKPAKKEAARSFKGKSFIFTVGPTGKIEDNTQLEALLQKIGEHAFRKNAKKGRIKEPDMIDDIIATQWFLWNSISSIPEPLEGVKIGQNWDSRIIIPNPFVIRRARTVTYTLDEIRPTEAGQIAVISSTFTPSDSVPHGWPSQYSGRFQTAGPFGFLRKYEILDLYGTGEELFNIDTGQIQQYTHSYQIKLKASFMIPLRGTTPMLLVNQTISMQRL